jgi:hypothetical protein
VNSSILTQSFAFLVPNEKLTCGFEKLAFSNDGRAREQTRRLDSVLQGTLSPGEIRVYALGSRERVEPIKLPSAPTREYHEVTPIGNPFGSNREAEIQLGSSHVGMTLAVVIQYRKAGEADRSFERPQEVLRVVGNTGSKPASFTSIPREGTDIWSRCSWAVFKHQVTASDANQLLKLKLVGETPPGTTATITAMWLK